MRGQFSKWDVHAIFSREYLSAVDPHGEPGFELVITVRCRGESNDTGRGANDPDNHYEEDRELVEAYLTLHPDNKRIELGKEVQKLLYEQLGVEEADHDDLIWKADCRP